MIEKSMGQVEAILVKPKGKGAKSAIIEKVDVEWGGFQGDKHFGDTMPAGSSQKAYPKGTEVRNTRQISIVSVEELKQIAEALGVSMIKPEWVGANMLVSGIDKFTDLAAGTRLYFENGVGLVVQGVNTPCTDAGSEIQENFPDVVGVTSGFPKKAIGKRGLVAWVERTDQIAAGETLSISLIK